MLIDSHAHLDMADFDADRDLVIKRARSGGVARIVTIGIDLASSIKAIEIAREYEFVYATVGYHPHNAKQADAKVLEKLRALASEAKVVAWGEIGLDFAPDTPPQNLQIDAFSRQLDFARESGLPVLIHCRRAHEAMYQIVKTYYGRIRGVMHSFSGDIEMMNRFLSSV